MRHLINLLGASGLALLLGFALGIVGNITGCTDFVVQQIERDLDVSNRSEVFMSNYTDEEWEQHLLDMQVQDEHISSICQQHESYLNQQYEKYIEDCLAEQEKNNLNGGLADE